MKKGDRVGAVLGIDGDVAEFLGYGIYDGEAVPQEAVGSFAKMLQETGMTNPKILLDSGKVVYGCECWWDSEKEIKTRLEACKIVLMDIDEIRKDYSEAKNPVKYKT
jgi:hypothetical protein